MFSAKKMMFSAKQAATPKGSIVIYDWNGTNWVSRGNPIYGSQACGEDLSNNISIRLSKDGNRVMAVYDKSVCSARGSVKVYGWTNNEWSIVGGAINQEYSVGFVDINQDGSKIAIGEPIYDSSFGRIRILSGTSWSTTYNFFPRRPDTGRGNFSFSADGRWLAVYQDGAPGDSWAGISIWDFISSTPSKKGSNFGSYFSDLQISDNGTTVAFINNQGEVDVYRFTSNAWTKTGGNSVEAVYGLNLSGDGNSFVTRFAMGSSTQFEVYSLMLGAFDSFWTRIGINTNTGLTTNPQQSVDINEDGRVVAIGDSNYNSGNGAVNVFYWNGSQWVAKGTTLNGSSGFGINLSISGDGDHLAVSTAAR